jgi:uncharacterized protein YjcR
VTKREKIEHLARILCDGNSAELARQLHVKQNTLSAWKSRDTIDYDRIAELFPQVRAEWLLRGEGEPIRNNETSQNVICDLEEMARRAREADELRREVAALRERCDRLTDVLLTKFEQ